VVLFEALHYCVLVRPAEKHHYEREVVCDAVESASPHVRRRAVVLVVAVVDLNEDVHEDEARYDGTNSEHPPFVPP
jgi:predicted component of type VI protein secretion system